MSSLPRSLNSRILTATNENANMVSVKEKDIENNLVLNLSKGRESLVMVTKTCMSSSCTLMLRPLKQLSYIRYLNYWIRRIVEDIVPKIIVCKSFLVDI